MFSLRDRYDAYVIIADTPTLNEKKACPIAPITTLGETCEKSGETKKFKPYVALGKVSEFMQNTSSKTNNTGIKILDIRSIPF